MSDLPWEMSDLPDLRSPERKEIDAGWSEASRLRKALREIVALQDRSFVSGEGLFIRAITIARKALKPTRRDPVTLGEEK